MYILNRIYWVIFLSFEEEIRKRLSQIEKEISIIKGIFVVSNYDSIVNNLQKVFTTKDRKLMWIYLDGKKTQYDIAKLVGKTQAAVSLFISHGKEFGLIDDSEGQAKKTINIIPSSWLDLKKKKGSK